MFGSDYVANKATPSGNYGGRSMLLAVWDREDEYFFLEARYGEYLEDITDSAAFESAEGDAMHLHGEFFHLLVRETSMGYEWKTFEADGPEVFSTVRSRYLEDHDWNVVELGLASTVIDAVRDDFHGEPMRHLPEELKKVVDKLHRGYYR